MTEIPATPPPTIGSGYQGSARDQIADYADRKGWTVTEAERWLSPNLGYDPDD